MEADFAAALQRPEDAAKSQSDLYMDFEQAEEPRPELRCPFCSEAFNIVGLCCHIYEEHSDAARNGVCPVCGSSVDRDMVGHITMEHASIFKGLSHSHSRSQSRRRLGREYSGSKSPAAPCPVSHARPDPLVSAFISTFSPADPSEHARPRASGDDESTTQKKLRDQLPDSVDREEQSRRSRFLSELLLSATLDE